MSNPKASSSQVSRRMARTPQKDTSAEMAIRRELHRRGFRYRVDYTVLRKPRRTADLAFPKLKIAVFIDGCFWHGCPEHGTWPKQNAEFWRQKIEANISRDEDTNERLSGLDWRVIRIWEHEAPEAAVERIVKVVSKAKNGRESKQNRREGRRASGG